MSTFQTIPGEVTRAQFARLRRMDLSYVCRLAKKGRLVLTPDGKRVRVAESIALLGQTEDPSKDGVRERFAEQRADGEPAPDAGSDLNAFGGDGESGSGGIPRGSMTDARRLLIEEQAASARLKREREEGRLVDAEVVRRATFDKARIARNALLGMVDVISSRLAAETNPAKVHEILDAEVRRVCDELAAGETEATRQ